MPIDFLTIPWLRLAVLILACYACLCLFAACGSNALLFPAPPASYQEKEANVFLQTPSGERIACLHLEASDSPNGVTVLFSHGNGEDLGYASEFLKAYHALGCSVFSYDYPGYGQSSGNPTEQGCYQAAFAAYEHLVRKVGVPAERVILHGRSLGGGPSCEVASKMKVGGLVLESSFITAFRVMTQIPLVPFDKFRNIDKLDNVSCPSLVIHGELDEVVPFTHGEKLFDALSEPKTFLSYPQAGHNNLAAVAGSAYWEGLKTFIGSIAEASE